MMRMHLAPLFLGLMLCAHGARAQDDLLSLVADDLQVVGKSVLIAEGHVEMVFRDYRLRAPRVVYDQTRQNVRIDGPLVLSEGGNQVILADSAELSDDLREGVIRSARVVLDRQLQIAANEVRRTDGRYTRMTRAVASSCQVCPGGRQVPLWEIRARSVLHDEETRQLYFEGAQFRVAGVPLAYLPRLRVPDPSVDRYTGFLRPTFSSSSNLGSGLSVPFFWTLGDEADLTISPFISTRGANLVEARYRQAFSNGWMNVTTAVARDRLSDDDSGLRLYVFGEGAFALPQGFTLTFGLQATSDPDYLSDYDVSEDDRLESTLGVERARRDELIAAGATLTQTLREGENNQTTAATALDGEWTRRFRPGSWIGGTGEWTLAGHAHERASSRDTDGPDIDAIADGRDVRRLSLGADWRREESLGGGVLGAVEGNLRGDAYWVGQDASADERLTRAVPTVSAALRWPLARVTASGAAEVLEPMVQVVASPTGLKSPLNEDSTLVEFDESNLFALNRFPGADAYEQGLRVNLGVRWTRVDPAGWTLGVTGGRVLRADDLGQFAPASGLDGTSSDWLAAARVDWGQGISVVNRALFSDSFDLSKNELRLGVDSGSLNLGSSYILMEADALERRGARTSEWMVDAAYDLTDRWTATTGWRYDFTAERAVRTDFGFVYRNECVEVDVNLSRRYRSWASDDQTTRFNLSVELIGFSHNADRPALRRQCAG